MFRKQITGAGIMTHTKEHLNRYTTSGCCGPMMMHGHRSCGAGLGIMLILVGMILLTVKMGWVASDLFWPVVFLTAGLAILALNLIRGRKPLNDIRPDKEV
jgi:hypothetical protein